MKTIALGIIALPFLLILGISCSTKGEKKVIAPYPAAYLEEMTIEKLETAYNNGTFTVGQVVKDYLSRIEAIDRKGPGLNSVIIINPDALRIADSLDKTASSGGKRGPLFGVPVLLKDNIDTHDSMPNTAGSNRRDTS